jgi:Rieske Fe-S protein
MNTEKNCKNFEDKQNARRAFLRDGALAVAGTLAMGVAGRAEEAAPPAKPSEAKADELVLKMEQNEGLAKVGGSQIVKGEEEIIVARTDASSFAACSARCPHKNALLEYSHEAKQFVCPLHESRFALDGKIVKGPAKRPLKNYDTDCAAIVSLKPSA